MLHGSMLIVLVHLFLLEFSQGLTLDLLSLSTHLLSSNRLNRFSDLPTASPRQFSLTCMAVFSYVWLAAYAFPVIILHVLIVPVYMLQHSYACAVCTLQLNINWISFLWPIMFLTKIWQRHSFRLVAAYCLKAILIRFLLRSSQDITPD